MVDPHDRGLCGWQFAIVALVVMAWFDISLGHMPTMVVLWLVKDNEFNGKSSLQGSMRIMDDNLQLLP